jgi:hypothetical protein
MTFEQFAQRLLQLLDEGRFVATYKFAVLLGLIEVLAENVDPDGRAPASISTRTLARKVVEVYWPHTRVYPKLDGSSVALRQNQAGQAKILALIDDFRAGTVGDAGGLLSQARSAAPEAFENLVRAVEFKLIEMPLGRLQLIGNDYDPFIYAISWEKPPTQSAVSRGDFAGQLNLVAGVGDHLLRGAPLFRPLIERTWALTVARWNDLPDGQLQTFLFGATRAALARVTAGLRELAGDRCMYCRAAVRGSAQIDHFIPWSRHFDDGIENLVYAHARCNNQKSAYLAAEDHVDRWIQRLRDPGCSSQLAKLAAEKHWESDPSKTLAIARSTYLILPPTYKLWVSGTQFAQIDPQRITHLLGKP